MVGYYSEPLSFCFLDLARLARRLGVSLTAALASYHFTIGYILCNNGRQTTIPRSHCFQETSCNASLCAETAEEEAARGGSANSLSQKWCGALCMYEWRMNWNEGYMSCWYALVGSYGALSCCLVGVMPRFQWAPLSWCFPSKKSSRSFVLTHSPLTHFVHSCMTAITLVCRTILFSYVYFCKTSSSHCQGCGRRRACHVSTESSGGTSDGNCLHVVYEHECE